MFVLIKRLVMLGMLVSLVAACASNGPTTAGAGEPQTVEVKIVDGPVDPTTAGGADPNETVCTRRHKVGSHFPRTICKTRREWDEDRREAQTELNRQQMRNQARRIDASQNF